MGYYDEEIKYGQALIGTVKLTLYAKPLQAIWNTTRLRGRRPTHLLKTETVFDI